MNEKSGVTLFLIGGNLILIVAISYLSISKLLHYSPSTSLSYAVSYFNFIYKTLTSSFDSNIFEGKVSGMDNKVSSCVNKVVSKLQLLTQLIQTKPTPYDTQ